jgi:2-keto-4-pentenoate hydratase/2-oxohepta-3-ene-1,7-dioic acid hydratase in catechol pathway
MKLACFTTGGTERIGVVIEDDIVEVTHAFPTMMSIIEGGDQALRALAAMVENDAPRHALAEVTLLSPVRPRKYLAIGMNYKKHLEEAENLGVEAPKHQFWFNKQTSCITGPFAEIDPGVSEKVDYEVELGVVIGRAAKTVSVADAGDHIFGYVVLNDVSARDWQFHSPTFTIGKSFDTHGPVGPWIVTADEIEDCHSLDLTCHVNGEMRQSSNTSQMIHNVHEQIAYLSTAFTLEPGDLLATGTPEGVGIARDPQVFLQAGDVIRCEIERLGVIENRMRRA